VGPRPAEVVSSLEADCQTTSFACKATGFSLSATLSSSLECFSSRRVPAFGVFPCFIGLESAIARTCSANTSLGLDLSSSSFAFRSGLFGCEIAFRMSSFALGLFQVGLSSGIGLQLTGASTLSRGRLLAGEVVLSFSLSLTISRAWTAFASVESSFVASSFAFRSGLFACQIAFQMSSSTLPLFQVGLFSKIDFQLTEASILSRGRLFASETTLDFSLRFPICRARHASALAEASLVLFSVTFRSRSFGSQIAFHMPSFASRLLHVGLSSGIAFQIAEISTLSRARLLASLTSLGSSLGLSIFRARTASALVEVSLVPFSFAYQSRLFGSQIAFEISSSAPPLLRVGLSSGIALQLTETLSFGRMRLLAGGSTLSFPLSFSTSRVRTISTSVEASLVPSSVVFRFRSFVYQIAFETSSLASPFLQVGLSSGIDFRLAEASTFSRVCPFVSEATLDFSFSFSISRARPVSTAIEVSLTSSAHSLRFRGLFFAQETLFHFESKITKLLFSVTDLLCNFEIMSTSSMKTPFTSVVSVDISVPTLVSRPLKFRFSSTFEVAAPTSLCLGRSLLSSLELQAFIDVQFIRMRYMQSNIEYRLDSMAEPFSIRFLNVSIALKAKALPSCLRMQALSAIVELWLDLDGSLIISKPPACFSSSTIQCSITASYRRIFASRFPIKVRFVVEIPEIPTLPIRWWPRLIVNGVDLSHRLRSCRLSFSFDSGAWTLDLELTNYQQLVEKGEGLDPFDPISRYNTNGPLLGAYNPVEFSLIAENGYVWKCFTGYVGPLDRSSQEVWGEAGTLSVSCVGPSQPFKDYFIPEWEARHYTQAIISREGRPDLLNRILMDQGFAPIIGYIDDPCFHVDEYIIGGVSLWEALENALAPTGFRILEYMTPEGLKIMVKDPLRFRIAPDRVLVGGFRARRITGNEADVRTWVAVVYRDRDDFQEKIVWAEADPNVVALFGIPDGQGGRKHRRMVYKTSERSLVDSESEARELAATILWDLQYPTPNIELEIPWIDPFFRPFQLIRAIGETISTDFGVMEIDWEWSWENPYGSTSVRGSTGRVIGAKGLWFAKDAKKELARIQGKLDELTNEACPRPDAPEVYGAWYVHADGSPSPVVDIYIPATPPHWASGIRIYVWRFKRIEEGKIGQLGTNWFMPQGKTYSDYRFGAAYRDYVVFTSGAAKNKGRKVITTLSNRVITASDLPPRLTRGDGYWIVRLKDIQSFEIGFTNYYRLTGLREGEAVAVSFAWIPRISR